MSAARCIVALAVALAGCRDKDPGESVAATESAPAEAEPAAANLPASCARYKAVVDRIRGCDGLSDEIRESLEQSVSMFDGELDLDRLELADKMCSQMAEALESMADKLCGGDPGHTEPTGEPVESGVALDKAALGKAPHPFGALSVLRPKMTREQIEKLLPNGAPDGQGLQVPVGVEELTADIFFDYSGQLDWVVIESMDEELLIEAWGTPRPPMTWLDPRTGWRADLDDDDKLTIGPFVPLADLLGRGPDGLAETKPIIGATLPQLRARFGTRLGEEDREDRAEDEEIVAEEVEDQAPDPGKTYQLLLPATEICQYFTKLELEMEAGKVARLHLRQCYPLDAARRAALAAMEKRWGRAVPARNADDRPVFQFLLPGRRIEAHPADPEAEDQEWRVVISRR